MEEMNVKQKPWDRKGVQDTVTLGQQCSSIIAITLIRNHAAKHTERSLQRNGDNRHANYLVNPPGKIQAMISKAQQDNHNETGRPPVGLKGHHTKVCCYCKRFNCHNAW
jgi:hypothetical protein